MNTLIRNANIVNEGKIFKGSVLIKDSLIAQVFESGKEPNDLSPITIYDAEGKFLIPGVIDDQVHFRQPGLTHKGDLHTESMAAVAGGITSLMEMPNTHPQTVTQNLLAQKYELGEQFCLANYSFYIGATNDNLQELLKTNPKTVCGIKVFMGSSTGNMLVDNPNTLEGIFKEAPVLVATHCEDEAIIQANLAAYKLKYGDDIPVKFHPLIRSSEACYKSTSLAVEKATKFGTRLHVLHLSTAKEMELFRNDLHPKDKQVTAEVCVHHLWFSEKDYENKGNSIKWNPAIKSENDRQELWKALLDGRIDVIATDHAPHTIEEKANTYLKCPSGGPLVQHSFLIMFECYQKGLIRLEEIVNKMCHTPAQIFKIEKRGFIRPGYYADLVLIDPNSSQEVKKENLLYKCGWSPFEGTKFNASVTHTFVNGHLAYENGKVDDRVRGKRLIFER
jgi:dihydroorotase